MKYLAQSFAAAVGLLSTVLASPAPYPVPQTDVASTPTANSSTPAAISSAAPTEIAVFTANGGIYTATEINSVIQIAGYQISIGGPGALVGGVQVSAASDGLVNGGQTLEFQTVTGSSASEVVTTSTASDGSTTVVSTSATVPLTAASPTASESGDASGSGTAASATESSSAAAVAAATARPQSAVAALGGIAGLLCLLA